MGLDLDIDLEAAIMGRPRKPLDAEISRVLGESDLTFLSAAPKGVTAPELKKLGDRHHTLARLLAAGVKEYEAAISTGYSASRISILKASPAFQELISLYRDEVKQEFTSTYKHMAGLAKDAVIELRERLEDDPSSFSNRELLNISTDLVDRTADEEQGGSAPSRIMLVGPEVEEQSDDS